MKVLNFIQSDATFSPCGKYRWSLKRKINKSLKTIIFIGLNPSLANSINDDATLTRLIKFSDCWGYGSLLVFNLFARISKDPRNLKLCDDPIGSKNSFELENAFQKWSDDEFYDLWLGWGTQGKYLNRNNEVLEIIEGFNKKRFEKFPNASKPYAIGITKAGFPRHPLYASSKDVLRTFDFFQKRPILKKENP